MWTTPPGTMRFSFFLKTFFFVGLAAAGLAITTCSPVLSFQSTVGDHRFRRNDGPGALGVHTFGNFAPVRRISSFQFPSYVFDVARFLLAMAPLRGPLRVRALV